MKTGLLDGYERMPFVIRPETEQEATLDGLLAWCERERTFLDETLLDVGAILFRGFGIAAADEFHTAAAALGGDLQNYVGGDSPRSAVEDKVYTSTEFPPDMELYLHNELSYAGWSPARVFFCCTVPPGSGGETTIGDSRRIVETLPTTLTGRVEDKGVAYIQNLHDGQDGGIGKSWQETFETDDKAAVEDYCERHGIEYRWTERGLWTRTVRDGIARHPVTGARAWFNQVDQFHALYDCARIDPERSAEMDEESWPCHATYGDGSPIAIEEIAEIRRAFAREEVLFPWQTGDLLMLDNVIAAHGRKPFTGERNILVAMA